MRHAAVGKILRKLVRSVIVLAGRRPALHIDAALRAEREAISTSRFWAFSVISRQIDGSKIAIINPDIGQKRGCRAKLLNASGQA